MQAMARGCLGLQASTTTCAYPSPQMRDYYDEEELAPEIELLEMRLQRARRNRIVGIISIVLIVAMLGLYVFSDVWRANRSRPPTPEPIEFVET